MFRSFASPHRTVTGILVALAAASAAGAVLLGIDDNPPGIALAMLAGTALVTAFVHHWRSSGRFLLLSAVSLGVVVVLGGVAIAIDIALSGHRLPGTVAPTVEAAGNALSLTIAFLGLPSVFVGLAGALVVWLTGRGK